jgi:hypothetical protein
LINVAQYTELIIVVVLSVFVPSVIAQKFFRPVVAVDIEGRKHLAQRMSRSSTTRRRRLTMRLEAAPGSPAEGGTDAQ